ncbi:MAG: carboxypeptidase-like regulatory domain-containing protein, partial [Bacteroidales bacterium]
MKKITFLLGLLMTFSTMFAQTITIKGRVVDENKSPLPGVSVFVEGTTIGTITD